MSQSPSQLLQTGQSSFSILQQKRFMERKWQFVVNIDSATVMEDCVHEISTEEYTGNWNGRRTEWHLPKTLPVVGDTATLGNKLVPQQ